MRGSTPKASSTLSITGIDFGTTDTTDFLTDVVETTAVPVSEEVDVVESRARRLITDEAVIDVTEIPESLFADAELAVAVRQVDSEGTEMVTESLS
jgi:hypothetical protein